MCGGVVRRHQIIFNTSSLPRRRGTCRYVWLAEYQVSVKASLAIIRFAFAPPAYRGAERPLARLYDSRGWWLRSVKSPRALLQQKREICGGEVRGDSRECGKAITYFWHHPYFWWDLWGDINKWPDTLEINKTINIQLKSWKGSGRDIHIEKGRQQTIKMSNK